MCFIHQKFYDVIYFSLIYLKDFLLVHPIIEAMGRRQDKPCKIQIRYYLDNT